MQIPGSYKRSAGNPASSLLPCVWAPPGFDWNSPLLELADPGPESRIALLGCGTLEIACELIRHGSMDVPMVRVGDAPHDAKVDVAVVPRATCPRLVQDSIACTRRMLAPLGTVVMGQVPADLLGLAKAHPRSNDFSRIQCWSEAESLMIRAELPLGERTSCG